MTQRHKSQDWITRTCQACHRTFQIREQAFRYAVCAECAAAALGRRIDAGTMPPIVVLRPDGSRMRTDANGNPKPIDGDRDLENTFALCNLVDVLGPGPRPNGSFSRQTAPRRLG